MFYLKHRVPYQLPLREVKGLFLIQSSQVSLVLLSGAPAVDWPFALLIWVTWLQSIIDSVKTLWNPLWTLPWCPSFASSPKVTNSFSRCHV
jgi:hypothetical protein